MIYCISCKSCDQHYISETQQLYASRKYQHEYAVKCKQRINGIAEHIRTTKHKIDWVSRIFLESDTHWRKRKIKESLFIDCLNPGKDITSKSIMNLEKGREISDCWKEFNPEIRKIFSKKIPGKLAPRKSV